MTEQPDTAKIRDRCTECVCATCRDQIALCDALDAARAERKERGNAALRLLVDHHKARAEAAEARIDAALAHLEACEPSDGVDELRLALTGDTE